MQLSVVEADFTNQQHAEALRHLMNTYACDPMGGGVPLPDDVKARLPKALAALPHAFSVIAYADGEAAGLVNCFLGFSTFQCAPLVNIHDVIVAPAHRGRGIGAAMFAEVESLARTRGCCKITLEVLEGNTTAQHLYRNCGFASYELDPAAGRAMFWQKKLEGQRDD